MSSLDVDLCVNYNWEAFVPFKYFVRPTTLPSSSSTRSFTCFPRLPSELQMQVFDLCDGATLFNLMHTCSSIRSEASKRFWNDENTWYCCTYEGRDDMLRLEMQHPVCYHCPEFGRRITQIQISILRMEQVFDRTDELLVPSTTTQKGHAFFTRVRKIFPAVRTVVLVVSRPSEGFPLIKDPDYVDAAAIIQAVVAQAPSDTKVLIAVDRLGMTRKDHGRARELWRVSASSWHLIEESWAPPRILLPVRRCTKYPLGPMMNIRSSYYSLALEKYGLQKLREDSYTCFLPAGLPWPCVNPHCNLTFPTEKERSRHFFYTKHNHHDWVNSPQARFSFCEYTPPDLEAAMQARYQLVVKQEQEASAEKEAISVIWDQEDTEEKRLFVKNLMQQLVEANAAPSQCPEGNECQWRHLLHTWIEPNSKG